MPEMLTITYAILLLVHVLLFAYWVGADLAVFYSANLVVDPTLSAETRGTVSEIMAFIDLFPRFSVPLTGAVGVQLAVLGGYLTLPASAVAAAWILALLWVGNGVRLFRNRQLEPAATRRARQLDVILRSTALALALCLALSGIVGGGFISSAFVTVKLLAFSSVIALSFLLRRQFAPFRPALNRILSGNGGEEDTQLMQRSLARSRPLVVGLWGAAVVAAAAGLWGPD